MCYKPFHVCSSGTKELTRAPSLNTLTEFIFLFLQGFLFISNLTLLLAFSAMHRDVSGVLLTLELPIPVNTTQKMLLKYKFWGFFLTVVVLWKCTSLQFFKIISRENAFLQKLWTAALHLSFPRLKAQFNIISVMGLNGIPKLRMVMVQILALISCSWTHFHAHQLTASSAGIQWTLHFTDTQTPYQKQAFIKKPAKAARVGTHFFNFHS